MGAPIINANEFAAFVLVFMRMSMVVSFAPVIGSPTVLPMAKAALALMLTFMIAPLVNYDASMMPMNLVGFIWLGVGELMLGFTLGFMAQLVVNAANMAGDYISFQMGLSIVNTMDPQSGSQVPVLSRIVYFVFIMVFIYANGHLLVVKALVESFKIAPVGLVNLIQGDSFGVIARMVTMMFILSIKVAAPVIGVLFCIKVSFGIMAKAVPQMNILFVGMPIYIVVGFMVMIVTMSWWPSLLGESLLEVEAALSQAINYFKPQ